MRILAIRFQNLNSLRGAHEVNLESGPLAAAGLFAITGPTGAGKSTILDAVTLALYARAARYGRESAEDMMSRCAGECSAAVDFECEHGRFTAKWTQRRAKGKADGNLQPLRHELSREGTIIEDKTRGVVLRVEALTGLDYDRFLRSVLLAQGQFAAFLRAGKDERADLLERITGSQIYSMLGALAWRISAENSKTIGEAGVRLEAAVLMPDDERAGIVSRLSALDAELQSCDDRVAVLAATAATAKHAVQWRARKEELATAAVQHAAAQASFAPDAARLARHAATIPFAEALNLLGEAERAAERASDAAAAAAAKAKALRESAGAAAGAALACITADEAATAAEIRDIESKRSTLAVQLAALESWMAARPEDASLAEKLPDLSAHVERAAMLGGQSRAADKKCQEARLTAAEAAAEAGRLAEAAAAAAEMSRLATVASTEAKSLLAALLTEPWTTAEMLENAVQSLAAADGDLRRMTEAHALLTTQRTLIATLAAEADLLRARADRSLAAENEARGKLDAARETESLLHELVRQEQLIRGMEEHRLHLEAGKPCPLCGSEEHPWADPDRRPAPGGAVERLAKHRAALQAITEAARAASNAKNEADKMLAAALAQQRTIQQSHDEAQRSLEQQWQSRFPGMLCSGEAIKVAADRTAAELASLSALALKVRSASEAARAAEQQAQRMEADAKICQARADAARLASAAAASAASDAGNAAQLGAAECSAHTTTLKAALHAAGEPDAEDAPATLARLKSREREWREAAQSRAEGGKRAAALGHELQLRTMHMTTLTERRRETAEAITRAGLPAADRPPAGITWAEASTALTNSIADSQGAEKLAVSLSAAAREAAERISDRRAALAAVLGGSEFADVAALRAAVMEPEAIRALTVRNNELREAALVLATRQEALETEAAAIRAEWHRLTGQEPVIPGEQSMAEAESSLAALTAKTNELRTERGALQQRLTSDDDARARQSDAAAKLEVLKSAAAPWARLNQLIGSANGDRFSRYAQSITLDHLTALANARLAGLCDRYRLVRAGAAADLQMQVSDSWQADVVRPLESLSGGETFLISLALALGLSELAGGRTRIATLFIDEGFGTLDSTALDIALGALEGLRAGHNTIGIISHVEALKSRLTTRIEVTLSPGGWSRLSVAT